MFENFIKIGLIILVILVIVVLLIKRFIYFRPISEFLPYKDTYQDISSRNLHGWFIGEKNSKTILICHGNSGNISHRQSIIDSLRELGYSVMIFDYSGYGRSLGIPSESQFYQDASIFTEMLMRYTDRNNIILYGESIGAPVAAYIARKYDIKTLIIDSGLPSIKKYISFHFNILGSILGFIFPEFNTEEFIEGYRGSLLVIHSLSDEIIPYVITDKIRKYAKQVINIQGTHNNRIIDWNQVDIFIKQNL